MAAVQRRKRIMVEGLRQLHLNRQAASGGELIMGDARFVALRTVEVALNDGGTRPFPLTALFSLQVHARRFPTFRDWRRRNR